MLPVAACELHPTRPPTRRNAMLSELKLKSAARREVRFMNPEQRAAFARLGRLLHANVSDAADRRPISLSTIGGSVQAGSSLGGCTLKARNASLHSFGRGCSYAHQFALQLASDCPGAADLEFANRAVGGTTTAGALPQLPLLVSGIGAVGLATNGSSQQPDLLVADFAVNDATGVQDWHGANGRGRSEPIDNTTLAADISGALDALLRHLCMHDGSSAILLLRAACCASIEGVCASDSMARSHFDTVRQEVSEHELSGIVRLLATSRNPFRYTHAKQPVIFPHLILRVRSLTPIFPYFSRPLPFTSHEPTRGDAVRAGRSSIRNRPPSLRLRLPSQRDLHRRCVECKPRLCAPTHRDPHTHLRWRRDVAAACNGRAHHPGYLKGIAC